LIKQRGDVSDDEMFRAFNMGLGMLAIVPQEHFEQTLATLPGDAYRVGEIVSGDRGVTILKG
jgi:phosphoribosylformylglycinamidine cyclo-ligase